MSGDSRRNSRRQREREERHAEKSRPVVEERFARERDEPEDAGRRTTSMSAAERIEARGLAIPLPSMSGAEP